MKRYSLKTLALALIMLWLSQNRIAMASLPAGYQAPSYSPRVTFSSSDVYVVAENGAAPAQPIRIDFHVTSCPPSSEVTLKAKLYFRNEPTGYGEGFRDNAFHFDITPSVIQTNSNGEASYSWSPSHDVPTGAFWVIAECGGYKSEESDGAVLVLEEQWRGTLGTDNNPGSGGGSFTGVVHYYDILAYEDYDISYPLDSDGGVERNTAADAYVSDFFIDLRDIFETELNDWRMGPINASLWNPDGELHVVLSGWNSQTPFDVISRPLVGDYTLANFKTLHNTCVPAQLEGEDDVRRRTVVFLRRYPRQQLATVAAHEFYHCLQINLALKDPPYTRAGISPDAPDDNHFFEGEAQFAETVYDRDGIRYEYPGTYSYLERAEQYLEEAMNTPYSEILGDDSYRGYLFALYWRFLYEQYCSGTVAEKMAIIKEAWKEREPYFESEASTLAPVLTRDVMNLAFQNVNGRYDDLSPEHRFDQSLADFALANYLLSDVISRPFTITDISRYDFPIYQEKDAYVQAKAYPEVSRNGYGSRPEPFHPPSLIINDQIPSTYGMDFIEVDIDPFQDVGWLHLQFESIPASPGTWFQVQVVTAYSAPGQTELVDVHLMNENWDYTWNEGALDLPLQAAPPIYRNKLSTTGMAGRRPWRPCRRGLAIKSCIIAA
jgi:hypothetical protein